MIEQPKNHCIICDKEIDKFNKSFNHRYQKWYFHKNRPAKYCSLECSSIGKKRNKLVQCKNCHQNFEVRPCSKQEFCNHSCAAIYNQESLPHLKKLSQEQHILRRQKMFKTKLKHMSKQLKIINRCSVCNNLILCNDSRKYCSKTCRKSIENPQIKKTFDKHKAKKRDRYLSRKQQLIDICGGKCQKCGYNKSLRAMTFHHRDPKDKSFTLDCRGLIQKSWDKIIEESEKCDLLCFNCHMELHDNTLN